MAYFGGFSALVTLPDGRLVAGSDAGRKLVLEQPVGQETIGLLSKFGPDDITNKAGLDLEALTVDPEGDHLWGAYEGRNQIFRFDRSLRVDARAAPSALSDWGENAGPEAFTRLEDGRFLAIEEQTIGWFGNRHRALIFSADPTQGSRAEKLEFIAPDGFRPVDLTPVSGGRALVLFRRLLWRLPPGFETAIGIVDIDKRGPDGALKAASLTVLDERFPQDNYEGIALGENDGERRVWLISDDNFMSNQRSLLLELRWATGRARQKARE